MNNKIFFEIHNNLPREGPGRDIYTKKAYKIIPKTNKPKILDIGCGTGDQTITLAKISKGAITAIDIHQPYLDDLNKKIQKQKLQNQIKTENKSMLKLNYPKNSFDIIWAEGSIYAIGFEKGLLEWKQYIKPKGYLAVHEMTWLKHNPPKEIKNYWEKNYSEMTTIENNLKTIKKCEYKTLEYFPLPEDAWWDFYYNPLEQRLKKLKTKYKNNPEALKTINKEQEEINLYKKYNKWYGSVFFIMQKN